MKRILTKGSHWPLEDLAEDLGIAEVNKAIKFGNQKGTINNPVLLRELVKKDVKHGYCIPLPLWKAKLIPNLLFAPMNIQHQNTIDETGKTINKREAHPRPEFQVERVRDVGQQQDHQRVAHAMRIRHLPKEAHQLDRRRQKKISQQGNHCKQDQFQVSFRRCNLSAATAIQRCTQLPTVDLILLYLCLTFGRSPCPNEWGVFSEPICNLATTILHNDSWDPTKLHSSTQSLVLPPTVMDDNVPFDIGKEMIVNIEMNPRGIHDIYIDDMIPLTVDIPGTDNLARCVAAGLLAIHATT